MVMTNNPQAVEDFDWEKAPEEEPASPGAESPEAAKVSESVASAPQEKKGKSSSMELLLDIPGDHRRVGPHSHDH